MAGEAVGADQYMGDDEARSEAADPMLEACLATMPDQLAQDARGSKDLCIISG